jgi:putative membrane protein
MKAHYLAAITLAVCATAAGAETPAQYVAKAGASDVYETRSSKLVLATSKDPKVRTFANGMIADHAKSTAMVKAAAMKAGLKPKPPMLQPKQQTMLADLTAAKGPDRDKAYVSQQKAAHQEALALHSGYASAGSSAPLKMAAGKIAPVVQHHIEMLSSM